MGDDPRDAEQFGGSALTEGAAAIRLRSSSSLIQPDDLARQVRAWWRYACLRARRLARRGGWIAVVWGAAIVAFGGAQGVWFEVEAGRALPSSGFSVPWTGCAGKHRAPFEGHLRSDR